jgi:hypothetical protein
MTLNSTILSFEHIFGPSLPLLWARWATSFLYLWETPLDLDGCIRKKYSIRTNERLRKPNIIRKLLPFSYKIPHNFLLLSHRNGRNLSTRICAESDLIRFKGITQRNFDFCHKFLKTSVILT